MNRAIAAAAAGILLLGIAAIWALQVSDGASVEVPRKAVEGKQELATPPRPAASPGVADVPAPEAVAASNPRAEPAPADDAVAVAPTSKGTATDSWDEVTVATRESQLGVPLARPVHDALAAARDRMETCFADETARLANAPPRKFDPNDPPHGPAVLDLHLERTGEGLRIASAEMEYLGTSTPELVACCRRVLVGTQIPVDSTPAAGRYRLKFPLQ